MVKCFRPFPRFALSRKRIGTITYTTATSASFLRLSLVVCLCCLLFTACAKPPVSVTQPGSPVQEAPAQPETTFSPLSLPEAEAVARLMDISRQGLSSWQELAPGIERSLAYVSRKPATATVLRREGLNVTWGELRASLLLMRDLLPRLDADPTLLATHFQFLQLAQDPVFTGYYEPAIEASTKPSSVYAYPLYAVPDDLKTLDLSAFHPRFTGQKIYYRLQGNAVLPYHDREAIDSEKALASRGLEIAWAKNPIDIFFLQIQGSGRLILPDNRECHVLYAGKNGREYVSLGRVMRNKGLLPADGISMQSIRDYLERHPYAMQSLLNSNPSYVFFRLSDSGPYGAINQILTPRVSLATDPALLPLGGVLAFTVPLPAKNAEGGFTPGTPFTGIGLAQDTGGAIKGHRLDFFSGYGDDATWIAGHMNTPGSVWLLLPRTP